MARPFRLAIDEETLTDELFAFVLDPRSTRSQRRIVGELRALAPGMIPVMEMMILDGVEERRYVRVRQRRYRRRRGSRRLLRDLGATGTSASPAPSSCQRWR